VVAQFGETAPTRPIGRQRVRGNPVPAGVLVEIYARVHRFIHCCGIQTGCRFLLRERTARAKKRDQDK
jgi:hypothetical protein